MHWNADHPVTQSLSRIFGAAGVYPLSLTSPLVYKAIRDDEPEEMLRLVRKCPATLWPIGEGQISPFLAAVIHGHDGCASALAKNYPHLLSDLDESNWTVLHRGMTLGNFAPGHAETLIRLGADVNAKDSEGSCALHYAMITHNPVGFADALLKNGANIDARNHEGLTPLMIAARNAKPAAMNLLLDNKADIDIVDEKGETAVARAIRCHDLDTATLLLSRGAKLDLDNEAVETALRVATMEMKKDFLTEIGKRFAAQDAEKEEAHARAATALEQGTQAPVVAMKPLKLKNSL